MARIMIIQKFKTEEEWITATVDFINKLSAKTIALSGGGTPKPVYKELGKTELSEKAIFFQVDERYVPKDHSDSNHKLITNTLAPKNFHYFDTSLSIEKSLEKYKQELPKSLDLCILGIGPDGHTASLFPNSKATNSEKKVTHTETNQFAIQNRLTLTFPQILASKNILVLLKNKTKTLAELQNPSKSTEEFPALKLLEHSELMVYAV